MKEFFNWLSTPGYTEEIIMIIVLILLLLFICYIIRRVNINIKGVNITQATGRENNKNENDKIKPIENTQIQNDNKKHDIDNNAYGGNISVTATQDYRIISLIIQAHSNRIREEMKQYCSVNGLDKKDRDSYMLYVDEKKNLYISELKEMFNREYVSYDIISIGEVYEIIEEVKDAMMNKLEKLYIKLRDISIDEHGKINRTRSDLFDMYLQKALEWRRKEYNSDDECRSILKEYLEQYNKSCETLILDERIDILNKQVQKIDTTKKDLTDIFLTKVIEKMNVKILGS
jgi:hypothetical protein